MPNQDADPHVGDGYGLSGRWICPMHGSPRRPDQMSADHAREITALSSSKSFDDYKCGKGALPQAGDIVGCLLQWQGIKFRFSESSQVDCSDCPNERSFKFTGQPSLRSVHHQAWRSRRGSRDGQQQRSVRHPSIGGEVW